MLTRGDTVPTPGPGGRGRKWCLLGPMRTCQGPGENCSRPLPSRARIYCCSSSSCPEGLGGAGRDSASRHRAGQKRAQMICRMTCRPESIQSKVCVYFIAVIPTHLLNKHLLSFYDAFSTVLGAQDAATKKPRDETRRPAGLTNIPTRGKVR